MRMSKLIASMAEPTSDIDIPRAQTIGAKAKDLAWAIEQKVVDKFGFDPSKKSVEQRLTDEFGTQLSEKSLQQIYQDKLSSDAEGRSTSEKVHRASLAMRTNQSRVARIAQKK